MDVQLPGFALCSCRRATLKLSAALFVQLETCASGLRSASIVTELLLGNFKGKIDFFYRLLCWPNRLLVSLLFSMQIQDLTMYSAHCRLVCFQEKQASLFLCRIPSLSPPVCVQVFCGSYQALWMDIVCRKPLILALDKSLIAASFISLTCNFPSEFFFFFFFLVGASKLQSHR